MSARGRSDIWWDITVWREAHSYEKGRGGLCGRELNSGLPLLSNNRRERCDQPESGWHHGHEYVPASPEAGTNRCLHCGQYEDYPIHPYT